MYKEDTHERVDVTRLFKLLKQFNSNRAVMGASIHSKLNSSLGGCRPAGATAEDARGEGRFVRNISHPVSRHCTGPFLTAGTGLRR